MKSSKIREGILKFFGLRNGLKREFESPLSPESKFAGSLLAAKIRVYWIFYLSESKAFAFYFRASQK